MSAISLTHEQAQTTKIRAFRDWLRTSLDPQFNPWQNIDPNAIGLRVLDFDDIETYNAPKPSDSEPYATTQTLESQADPFPDQHFTTDGKIDTIIRDHVQIQIDFYGKGARLSAKKAQDDLRLESIRERFKFWGVGITRITPIIPANYVENDQLKERAVFRVWCDIANVLTDSMTQCEGDPGYFDTVEITAIEPTVDLIIEGGA
jgi:hypothetical protein